MAVQLQWSLDNTVGAALSVARGIFLAANNDNVQPLAIASCEKFGNTIAMCQETCRKMEDLTKKAPEPVPIRFLKAYAGFDAADTATQLSKSQAGVQFLGLAAALLNSMTRFNAGIVLHTMLMSSASDTTLLPTTRQLKDLLTALHPRLTHSGFLNSVIGWHTLLGEAGAAIAPNPLSRDSVHPGSAGVDSLVAAFRTISRIGDADVYKVRIEARSCVSWVVAFTKWCLGLPPSVYSPNGTLLLDQPESKVDLLIKSPNDPGPASTYLKVSIQYAREGPSDLLESWGGGNLWLGMISLEQLGQLSLSGLHNFATGKQAITQALPHAINQIIYSLRSSMSGLHPPPRSNGSGKGVRGRYDRQHDDMITLGLSPFPPEQIVSQTASRLLGEPVDVDLRSPDEVHVPSLSTVQAHIKILAIECRCPECCRDSPQEFSRCLLESFFRHFAEICADVLSSSLYAHSTSLLVQYIPRSVPPARTKLTDVINSIIFSKNQLHSGLIDLLLECALELGGHSYYPQTPLNSWLMTSRHGQVIYPTIYETLSYTKEGYLTLNCIPGILKHNGEVYSRVVSSVINDPTPKVPTLKGAYENPVKMPYNNLRDDALVWHLEEGDFHISASVGLQTYWPHIRTLPQRVFERLAISVLLESCVHSPSTVLEHADELCAFTSPLFVHNQKDADFEVEHGFVSVVAVDGSDAMRFLALTSPDPVSHSPDRVPSSPGYTIPPPPVLMLQPKVPFVLRKHACLSCCLDMCRKLGFPVLVL